MRNLTRALAILLAFASATDFVGQEWATQSVHIAIFGIAALLAGRVFLKPEAVRLSLKSWAGCLLAILLPVWPAIQVLTHSTVSRMSTTAAALHWASLACIFLLATWIGTEKHNRRLILEFFAIFATGMGVLCLAQLFTSEGNVFWLFPTGNNIVYGTFPYYNHYAEFVELALPVAVWLAFSTPQRMLAYVLCVAVLYASVIASASRAGTIICTAELAFLMLGGFIRERDRIDWRRSAVLFAMLPVATVIFTLLAGWQHVWGRFQLPDPYAGRREFAASTLQMIGERPLSGYGVGTFPLIYPQHASIDPGFGKYISHAHNDWAEFAAEGGLGFLAVIATLIATRIPAGFRSGWGLGLVALTLHACIDFPFPAIGISGWAFAVLGLL